MKGEESQASQSAIVFAQIPQVLLAYRHPLPPHRVLLHGHGEEALRLQGGELPADAAARPGEAEGRPPCLLVSMLLTRSLHRSTC